MSRRRDPGQIPLISLARFLRIHFKVKTASTQGHGEENRVDVLYKGVRVVLRQNGDHTLTLERHPVTQTRKDLARIEAILEGLVEKSKKPPGYLSYLQKSD